MDITVIIPTYNRAWALPKAISSCMEDTGIQVQVIVVDDGSNDGSWELLAQTKGIEIYRQQHWGKPWAVNMALTHAEGKYIKFLDSDDWLVAGSLAKQFKLAEAAEADVVVAGYKIYENEQYLLSQNWIDCDDFIAQNLGECDSSHYSAFLFRKGFINDIPHRTSFASADFASRDDRCFMLEVALKEPKIAIMSEPALCHRQHKKGRLQFQSRIRAACTNYQHVLIYKNIIKQLADTNRLTKRRIDAAVKVLWPLCHWVAKDDLNEAVELYKWILELSPGFNIPDTGGAGLLYKLLGFKAAEKAMALRRLLKY